MNNPCLHFRTFLVITACTAMAGSCGVSFAQADEIKESNTQQLRQPMEGPPGFRPPMLMMQHRSQEHQGPGPQIHRPEMHQPAGPFAEDQKRIAALTESAERLSHAGLPDAAHGLMERAGQIKRELAEKQERIQREEHERAKAKMREQKEQAHHQQRLMEERKMDQHRDRAEHADRPALPIHELHEQLVQLRREMHSINQKVSHLTEMIEHHHRAQERRGHHEDMDEDDDDEKHNREDSDDDDDEMPDRDENGDDEGEMHDHDEDSDDEKHDREDDSQSDK